MTLTNSNLFSESYTIIKDFLNTNITDPRRRFRKQWIHPSLPNMTAAGFDGYPFMVVDVSIEEDSKALDRNVTNKNFRGLLTIYSPEATEVDSICDEIFSKFKDETLTDSLSEFKSINLASSDFSFQVISGRKIHLRTIGLIGVKRI